MIEKLVRKNIHAFQPYIPGKPINEVKRELGLKDVIKLASNENPLGPSAKALQALKKGLKDVFLYPDSGILLKQKIAKKTGLKPSQVILGNGSDELIEIIAKTFLEPADEIVVSESAFIRYKMGGELMNSTVVAVPMKDYTHDLAAMRKAITEKTKIIFIANPNNPTGTYVTAREVEEFLCGLRKDILVVFDEAYYEYVTAKDYSQTIPYLKKDYPLIILRTFSKMYGLAGLRIGYGFSTDEIIGYLERVRPPFNVNSLAYLAAEAGLDDVRHVRRCRELVEDGKEYFYHEFKRLNIGYIPSAGNFVLVDLKQEAAPVCRKLLQKGIIVRPMGEYQLPTCFRVTIGLKSENREFIKALEIIKFPSPQGGGKNMINK